MDRKLLEIATKNSTNKLQTLIKLGFRTHAGNYKTLDKYLKQYEIDTSHFDPYGTRVLNNNRWEFKDIFCKDSKVGHSGTNLKSILYKKGLKKEECELCSLKPEGWSTGRISLILDHINGDRKDHRIENLRIVCPNCDSTLPTYTGRNKKKKINGDCNR